LGEADVEQLFKALEDNEGYSLTVDLEAQTVECPDGVRLPFAVDEFRKHCLLNGLDDIGLTLQQEDAIRRFEKQWRTHCPWLFGAISSTL